MKWSIIVGNVLRMMFGLPYAKGDAKTPKYKIKPKMINPDVVVMDMDSFRSSRKVQQQIKAAKKATTKS